MFQTKAAEKIKTHILCSVTPPPRKIVPFMRNLEKYCSAGQSTGYYTAHAHCMLDTQGYKQTLTICNTYCFFPLQQWLQEPALLLRYT